jgi:serine/threonine-protein kinase
MVQPSSAGHPHTDPFLGKTINDRFKILSLIAKGGMGRVYRAEQAPLGRIVALKVLHPTYTGEEDPEFSKRFTLEASVVSRLKHPNTVTVYDYGQTPEGVLFMAMELLEGRTLHRLLREEGALDPARAIHIALQVARSLREAHGQGVIHRDLKPANIFLIRHDDDDDFVKVLDFGLVKNLDESDGEGLTKTGLFMGSPKYMAPEQIRGDRCTPATDVYALGVILFEMLTGKVPFERNNSANLLLAHVNDPVPTLQEANPLTQVTPPLEALVYRCLSKAADDRFQSMDELITALKHAAGIATALTTGHTGEHAASLSAPRAIPSGDTLAASSGISLSGPRLDVTGSQPAAAPSSVASPVTAPVAPASPPPPARAASTRSRLVIGASVLVSVGLVVLAVARALHAPAPPPQTPVATSVSVVLESDPSGAEVLEHGTVIGRTPLRETWTGSRGAATDTHTFTFRAPGYADAVVTLSGPTLVHLARLQRLEAPPSPPLLASPDAAPASPPAPVVEAPNLHRVRPPSVRPPSGRSTGRLHDAGGPPAGYREDPY